MTSPELKPPLAPLMLEIFNQIGGYEILAKLSENLAVAVEDLLESRNDSTLDAKERESQEAALANEIRAVVWKELNGNPDLRAIENQLGYSLNLWKPGKS